MNQERFDKIMGTFAEYELSALKESFGNMDYEESKEILDRIKESYNINDCLINKLPILSYTSAETDPKMVEMILEKFEDININKEDHFGVTAFGHAVANENLEMIKLLGEAGANVNKGRKPPLFVAISLGIEDKVLPYIPEIDFGSLLLAVKDENLELIGKLFSGAKMHDQDVVNGKFEKMYIFEYVMKKGNLEMIEMFLKEGVDLHNLDTNGDMLFLSIINTATPSIWDEAITLLSPSKFDNNTVTTIVDAILDSENENKEQMLDYFCNIFITGESLTNKDSSDLSPIMIAMLYKDKEAVKTLSDNGAIVSVEDVIKAITSEDYDILELLLDLKEDQLEELDLPLDGFFIDELYKTIRDNNSPKLMAILSKYSAFNIGYIFDNEETFLMDAVDKNSPALVKVILNHEDYKHKILSVDATDSSFKSSLFKSAKGSNRIVELLIKNGAKVNRFDNNSGSVIMEFVRKGTLTNVKSVMKENPDFNAFNSSKVNAAVVAIKEAPEDVAKYVIANGDINFNLAGENSISPVTASTSNITLLREVIKRGEADLNSPDGKGDYPVVACFRNLNSGLSCLVELEKAGAKVFSDEFSILEEIKKASQNAPMFNHYNYHKYFINNHFDFKAELEKPGVDLNLFINDFSEYLESAETKFTSLNTLLQHIRYIIVLFHYLDIEEYYDFEALNEYIERTAATSNVIIPEGFDFIGSITEQINAEKKKQRNIFTVGKKYVKSIFNK